MAGKMKWIIREKGKENYYGGTVGGKAKMVDNVVEALTYSRLEDARADYDGIQSEPGVHLVIEEKQNDTGEYNPGSD